MPSKLPRIVAYLDPALRERLARALAKLNADSGANLSEGQLVQMAVKYYLDYLDKTTGDFKAITYPEFKDSPLALVGEDKNPDDVAAGLANLSSGVKAQRKLDALKTDGASLVAKHLKRMEQYPSIPAPKGKKQ